MAKWSGHSVTASHTSIHISSASFTQKQDVHTEDLH